MSTSKTVREKNKNLFFNIVIFLLIFFSAIRLPLDTDFWWHIRAGQLSVSNGSVVLEDLTSFTTNGADWINHSWLSQIIYYLVFHFTNNLGLMLVVAIISTLSMLFIYFRLNGNPLIKGFVTVLAVLTTAVIWSPRPQLISLLLFSILSFLIYKERSVHKTKQVVFLSLLFLIWSNLHAGFSVGIIFIGLYFLGLLFDKFLNNWLRSEEKYHDIKNVGLLLAISSLIVMINPNGINIWKVQFNTISIPTLQNLIPEWASPNFHELYQQPFLWLWILLVFFIFVNRTKYSFSEILPLLFFGALGFISRRNYVYFAVLAIPILNNEINVFIYYLREKKIFAFISNKQLEKLKKEPEKIVVSKIINLTFFAFLILITLGKIIYLGSPIVFHTYEKQFYPFEALNSAEDFDNENMRCLNSYAWGGYISWKEPQIKIFIDGRTDLYGEEIIQDWLTLINASDGWEEKLAEYNINCVLIEPEYQIVNKLHDQNWSIIFRDNQSIFLLNQNVKN